MILFFDTETTGFPARNQPLNSPSQPRIVQLAAMLTDDAGTVRSTVDLTIRPDGWIIPEDVSRIHGITTELALAAGVPIRLALSTMKHLTEAANLVVAHNLDFDLQLLDIEFARFERSYERKPTFCTMRESTQIVNLPPTPKMAAAGRNSPKPPKLQEAYQHAFGRTFDNAHNALADVTACKDVYFWLKTQRGEKTC